MKEAPESSLTLILPCEDTSGRESSPEPNQLHAGLECPVSRTVGNKCLLSHSVDGIFVIAAQAD